MVCASTVRWLVGLTLGLVLTAGPSCRRPRFPSRGDAAAVVVVAPRKDAAPPPTIPEQEPNDNVEQAQALGIDAESSRVALAGELLPLTADGKTKDVDIFKLVVPGGDGPTPPALADAGGTPEDFRAHARRLSVEVTAEGTVPLALHVLDGAAKIMEGIAVEAGQTAGMPNLAVVPGQTYYLRVRANRKAAKAPAAQPTAGKYLLTVRLGDFEIADEREPNDTRELANPVAVAGGAEWSGYFGWPRDEDFFRIPSPDVLSAMDVDLDAVDGVGPSLQVIDAGGGRLAAGKGRKGERLALRNVVLRPASPDAGPASRFVYLVARAESGANRAQRYVLRVAVGAPKANVEVEPNDTPATATAVKDGTMTGYLPVGDIDFFRYEGQGARDLTVEVSFPARVRGKVAVFRSGAVQPVASAEAKKARQTVTLPATPTLGEQVLLRISQPRADGNANDPYTLRIASAVSSPQQSGAPPSAVPVP